MRVDGWIEAGTEVTAFYDPMLAKIIARGATRELAIANLAAALAAARIDGIETNLPYLVSVLKHPAFVAGEQTTALLSSHEFQTPSDRSAGRRHADHRAGLARAPRAVGRGRAALRADGSAGAATRQSHGGQRRRCGGARDDGHGRDAALRCRRGDRARRRGDGCEPRRARGFILGTVRREAWQRAGARKNSRRRPARLSRGARQFRRPRISRQPLDLHARTIRWPRRTRAARGRRAAPDFERT